MKKYSSVEIRFISLHSTDIIMESEQTDQGTNLLGDTFDEYTFTS